MRNGRTATARRILYVACLAAGLLAPLAVVAQAPPSVPALPDTERRTSYSLVASQCSCAVNFALFGDNTDVDEWVQVWVAGVHKLSTDPTYGWAITSPTGPIATIPRPITDAVLTFTNPQTATVQIVGARRPRRLSQFRENRGVAARDLNQALTDIIAMLREDWDKINDVTGRSILSQPGNTVGPLPLPAVCVSAYLGFDSTGLNPVCIAPTQGTGNVVGASPSVIGNIPQYSNTTGNGLADSGVGFPIPVNKGGTNAAAAGATAANNIGALAEANNLSDVANAATARSNLGLPTTVTGTIASGAITLSTATINSATCTAAQTVSTSNVAVTDVVQASFNSDPTLDTGYIPSTAGMLAIIAYPTSGDVNFKVCNNSANAITPSAVTLNYRVVR
jgi:hypothetical protein